MNTVSYDEAKAGKEKLKDALRDRAELSGIGVYRVPSGGYGIKVNLKRPLSGDDIDFQALIPGIEVIVKVIGPIRFLSLNI